MLNGLRMALSRPDGIMGEGCTHQFQVLCARAKSLQRPPNRRGGSSVIEIVLLRGILFQIKGEFLAGSAAPEVLDSAGDGAEIFAVVGLN
jgi:hypothetical protein